MLIFCRVTWKVMWPLSTVVSVVWVSEPMTVLYNSLKFGVLILVAPFQLMIFYDSMTDFILLQC